MTTKLQARQPSTAKTLSIRVQVYLYLLYPSTPTCLEINLMGWVVQGIFPLVFQWSWIQDSVCSHSFLQSYWLIQPPLFFT